MKLHRFFIIFLSLLLITCDMRADGGDVLERIIRLPGTKGTVYSLLSKVSEQSGYLFVYDSKVVNNDIEVRTKKKNCTVRQAIYEIVGDRTLELKVIGNHICLLRRRSYGSGKSRKRHLCQPISPLPVFCGIKKRVIPL